MNPILFVWEKNDEEEIRSFALEKICLECPEQVIEILAKHGLLTHTEGKTHNWVADY